eukprot:TRINITY_DN6636_c0_g1_i7.p1 TRINITY_DN6636_c0_g1~~TRINITY_DN6636_c0_g1_i7.p1  ORF type:complete len:210 (+),score=-32.98 TRINITY_DN6636_c0_g1_i7:189-818(+)
MDKQILVIESIKLTKLSFFFLSIQFFFFMIEILTNNNYQYFFSFYHTQQKKILVFARIVNINIRNQLLHYIEDAVVIIIITITINVIILLFSCFYYYLQLTDERTNKQTYNKQTKNNCFELMILFCYTNLLYLQLYLIYNRLVYQEKQKQYHLQSFTFFWLSTQFFYHQNDKIHVTIQYSIVVQHLQHSMQLSETTFHFQIFLQAFFSV